MSNFEKTSWKYANIIHENLKFDSNYLTEKGEIISAKYLVAIDDDITSAFMAAETAKRMVEEGQNPPVILCVGGKGMMSFWTHKTSEAKNLENIIEQVLPKKYYDNTVLLDQGTNSGKNVCDIRDYVANNGGGAVIFCLTKRLSLRVKLTQEYQADGLDLYYNVSEHSLQDACRWYNCKALCDNHMMYHELAAIFHRCILYGPEELKLKYEKIFEIDDPISRFISYFSNAPHKQFQAPIPESMLIEEVINAAAFFAEHYRIKLTRNPLASLGEYVKLVRSFYKYEDLINDEKEEQIKYYMNKLRS